MATVKAVQANPVRGHYVTTIHTGRGPKHSGRGFGKPRLGGLINAYVEGVADGGTSATRMMSPRGEQSQEMRKLQDKIQEQETKARQQKSEKFFERREQEIKEDQKLQERGEKIEENLSKQAEEASKEQPAQVKVDDKKVVAKDSSPPSAVDDSKEVAKAKDEKAEAEKKKEGGK